jgi:uncharacterized protein YndB with AHSA1/START domain
MSRLIVENKIEINAPIEKVWDVLTNPAQTKKYMFGCETVSDWKVGSALLWQMMHEGKEFIPVSGFILEIIPNELLKYSVIDPHAAYPSTPENHLNVTYHLTSENGKTIFTVTQDGFETAADGEKRYKDVYNNGDGWNPILIEIKKVAESN